MDIYLDAPYKFSGKELDDEGADRIAGFNLYYFGARNYDPLSCMWKQVDPMATKYPGLSPYNYCADNPVSNYDPDGNDYSYANNFLTWSFKRSLDSYWNNMVNSWQEFNAGMGWGAYSAAKSSVVGLGGFLADASTKSMAEAGYQYGIGIHYGITHASEIWDQYSADISNTWNSGPGGKGELIGYYGTKIGLAYLTTKGFGALSRTAFAAKEITSGWRVGQPITNLTKVGKTPVWSTVRQRFWKNEALLNFKNYSPSNLARMKRGIAPQRINPYTGLLESMELHHIPPMREGGLFRFKKMWPDEHKLIDPYRH